MSLSSAQSEKIRTILHLIEDLLVEMVDGKPASGAKPSSRRPPSARFPQPAPAPAPAAAAAAAAAAAPAADGKRRRRAGAELVRFRKTLQSERKRGVPVTEIARKHGVSSAYIYQLGL